MSFSMIKERPFLFAPTAPIALSARISGVYTEEQLKDAAAQALNAQELMKTRVQLNSNGTAIYEPIPEAVVSMQSFDCDFADLLRREESYIFDLSKGEYVRFFFRLQENSVMLVLFAHQLIADCDGVGFLMADVAAALAGETVEAKPVRLYDSSWLPRGVSMSLNARFSNKMLSMRWKKLKKSFSWDDRLRMTGHYWGWGTHGTSFIVDALSPEDYARLKKTADEQGVSVSSAVAAALTAASGSGQKIRCSDTVRPEGHTGLGNFSVTYAFDFIYDPMTSLWNNAYRIEEEIRARKNDPLLRYNQLLLIPQLPPTGVDSVYFSAYDKYQEPLAHNYCRMFGLSGEPSGIALTETALPMAAALDMSVLAAPVPPNCLYAVGITPFMDGLIITLRTERTCDPDDLNWFHAGVAELRLPDDESED